MKFVARILLLLLIFITGFVALNYKAYSAPPQNFQTTQVIGSGLDSPTGMEFAPDGRLFILQRTGDVRIYKNGQLLGTPFASLPSSINGDKGLIGVVFDPDFDTNHFVYFYHTSSQDDHGRLVRFDASGDVGTNYTQIYDTNEGILQFHAGGGLAFGPDGKLYLTIGDNGIPSNAQSLNNPFGKMHRFNKDGTIPADNPFYNTPGAVKSIWAYGLRNPWRFQFDSETGKLYAGDVGQDTWEEINKIEKGANYAWPTVEGNCNNNCSGFTNPIYAYNHNGGSAAISLGPVYRSNLYPQEFKGSLFFSDYAIGFIKRITLDANGNSAGVQDFDLNAGSAVDSRVGTDGALYYVTYFPGRLYKVDYSTTNQAPTVNASADVTTGNSPLTVNFSSNGTQDPDNDPLTYAWDFGDGTNSTQPSPTKVYNTQGTYTVELVVSDGTHSSQAVPIVIQVGVPPSLTISAPQEGHIFRAGDTISYTAFATDAVGVDLPESAFTVEVLFHHQTHTHPFLGPITGNNTGMFTIPTTGETSADIWYEIIVTATDNNNLSTTKSVNIFPKKSNITINTNPAALPITLDGTVENTPQTFEAVVGLKRDLSVPPVQVNQNGVYGFTNWSDGGAASHQITTQETDTTYTANYNLLPQYSASYFNNQSMSGNPVLTRADANINFDWANGSPDPQVQNNNFSARWVQTSNFAAGDYEFTTIADDGVRLYVDNVLILDKWIDQAPTTYKVTKSLAAGNHTVKLEYYENGGGAVAKMSYLKIGDSTPPPTGETNIAPTGTAYRWSKNTADGANTNRIAAPGINDDNLNVDVSLNAGADDNANAWEAAGIVWSTPQSEITSVKFKNGSWNSVQNGAFTSNFKLQFTTDGTTWADSTWTISPAYNYDSPSASQKTYTFTGTPVTGITGARVVGQVRTPGALSWIAHAVELQVFTGDTTPPPDPNPDPGPAPQANMALTGSGYIWSKNTTATANVNRVTAAGINDDDLNNDVVLNNGDDNANAWEGAGVVWVNAQSTIASVVYKNGSWNSLQNGAFTANLKLQFTDDGTTWVDSTWTATPSYNYDSPSAGNTTYTFIGPEQNNKRGVRVVGQVRTPGALSWIAHAKEMQVFASTQVPPSPPTGSFTGEYWDNKTLTGAPKLTRQDATINFDWGQGSPDPQIPNNLFSARWTKSQDFTAGNYAFTLKSDDGIRFWIDNQIVVDDWTDHATRTYTPIVSLTTGIHILKIEYYENSGGAVASFQ